jgi:hypothetical protein
MRTFTLLVAMTLFGCDSQVAGGPGNSGGSSGSNGSGGASGGSSGQNGGGTSGGGGGGGNNCGVQTFPLQRRPSDLLIVLDKSGSMNENPTGSNTSKWSQVTAALDAASAATANQISWGLKFFPSDNTCGVNAGVDVNVSTNNASAISSAIGGKSPGGNTPTRQAMNDATAYLSGLNDGNAKYIVLATDGAPNCPAGASSTNQRNSDAPAAEQAVADAASMGIHTFVIGIATDSTADATLTQMAINGMEPQTGTPKYFLATNQADFSAAMSMISGQIITCTFPLASVPPNPGLVSVSADGQTVPRDTSHANGWDFAAGNMSVIFYGPYCQRLQAGQINSVQTTYGCPPVM